MGWRFVLTDLQGNALSELPGISSKTYARPMGSTATAAFSVPLERDEADTLIECSTLLRIYEDLPAGPHLHGHLRQITAEEVGDANGGSVAATFADPSWVLSRRLCGKTPAGYTNGTAVAPVDRGTIVADLLNTTNAESPTGLALGTVAPSSTTFVEGWAYKPVLEAIAELSATLDGPDWQVRPVEYAPTAGQGTIGLLDVAPSIGQLRPDAIFEFGDGKFNVKSYTRTVTMDGTANRVFHLPADPATQSVLSRDDTASIAARGLLESVVAADITPDQLRAALLDHHIAVRSGPKQTITFEPVSSLGNTPQLGSEDGFDVGDIVRFRGAIHKDRSLRQRLDGLFRVYQASVTVNELGVATTALTVVPS
jgi:hypothetical protein